MRYIPGLDGLRAIAVLAVVAYHAGLPISAGFVGVDIFFVISGYVITRMLAREHRDTGRIDFAGFYARRVRRILPALVVVVASVLVASTLLLSADYRMAVVKSAVASMAVAANFHFQAVTGGYFDASAEQMPLLNLWSLAVEEQFYFVWPLLLVLLLRFRRAPIILAALAIASFAFAQAWASGPSSEVAFYQMPARFWELAVGGLIALSAARSRPAYGYAGLAVLAVAVMVPLPDFPGTGAIPAVLGSALVVHALHGGASMPALQLRPVRYIGLISYSFYLWHWPLLAIARAYSMDAPSLSANLALCGVAFVLAALSYRYVETPFRHSQAPKGKAIAVGLATCALLAGCAGAVGATIKAEDSLATRTAKDFDMSDACHFGKDDPAKLPPASCGSGDVVLWGDSHAHAWREYADRFGSVTPLTRSGCAPSIGNSGGSPCDQFNALAVERAKRARVVVMSSFWIQDFGNGPAKLATKAGIEAALAAVAPRVQRVILMGPLPVMPYAPHKCIQDKRVSECAMPRSEFDKLAAESRAFLMREAAVYPSVEYVETAGFFCSPTVCPMMKDGYSLYWDDDHISASAARNFR